MIVWVKRLRKKCNEENLLIIKNTMQFYSSWIIIWTRLDSTFARTRTRFCNC